MIPIGAKNRQIVMERRPVEMPTAGDFAMVEGPVPGPGDGEVLTRAVWLSLDPYMRGRMSDRKSYAPSVPLGGVMVGRTVSRVIESRDSRFTPGDIVLGPGGWQDYAALPAASLRKLDSSTAPVSTALGVLGMPGMTAYVGLLDIGRPREGETVVVSAASGAVGSVAGQIARIKGCRVLGIAGGAQKCRYVVEDLGFDACVDHRAPGLGEALAQACPNGIDVYFENVGGAVQEAVWPLLNDFARVPVCGLIAQYNDAQPHPGPNLSSVLTKRLSVRGFIVSDHGDRWEAFYRDVSAWVRDGRMKYREDVVEGLERAPEAFIGLLQGRNFGKLLVRVCDDAGS
ncbi:MAG TPA: NADP-dependent oxidoreductase [bacterium]|nr:NADP-dependent oxidoreductase [bacterium]